MILTAFVFFVNLLTTHASLVMPLTPEAPKYVVFSAFHYVVNEPRAAYCVFLQVLDAKMEANKTDILINYFLFSWVSTVFFSFCINFMFFLLQRISVVIQCFITANMLEKFVPLSCLSRWLVFNRIQLVISELFLEIVHCKYTRTFPSFPLQKFAWLAPLLCRVYLKK